MSELPQWLRSHQEGATVQVLVQPRAGTSRIVGIHGDALKIRVAAAPVDGAANAELGKFLAAKLSVKPRQIEIISGQHARRKSVLIRGASAARVLKALRSELD